MLVYVIGGAAIVLFVIVALVAALRAGGGGDRSREADEDLSIDLAAMTPDSAPNAGPAMDYYGTPVRLVVLVIAPLGRGEPPAKSDLPQIAECLIPGLMRILSSHHPVFRLWPGQLSATGFTNIFRNNVRLPGDRGRGTRWCSVLGRFHADGRPFMAGVICASDEPSSLSEVTVEHDGRWLDVLRIRNV